MVPTTVSKLLFSMVLLHKENYAVQMQKLNQLFSVAYPHVLMMNEMIISHFQKYTRSYKLLTNSRNSLYKIICRKYYQRKLISCSK